jgi:hypothetical protein
MVMDWTVGGKCLFYPNSTPHAKQIIDTLDKAWDDSVEKPKTFDDLIFCIPRAVGLMETEDDEEERVKKKMVKHFGPSFTFKDFGKWENVPKHKLLGTSLEILAEGTSKAELDKMKEQRVFLHNFIDFNDMCDQGHIGDGVDVDRLEKKLTKHLRNYSSSEKKRTSSLYNCLNFYEDLCCDTLKLYEYEREFVVSNK